MPSVFLSHSSKDKPFAKQLAAQLRQAGVDVWLDEVQLDIGDSLIERIGRAIDESDFVIAILSRNSISSFWVKKELEIAMTKEIESKTITVLPIIIDKDCKVPGFLRDKLYADFTDPKMFVDAFSKLLRRIERSDASFSAKQAKAQDGIPLHVIWILDVSSSMRIDGKIQALNNAIREFLPHLMDVANETPNIDTFISCIRFSRGAEWYVHRGTHLSDLKWVDVEIPPYPFESTDMGAALYLVADYLKYMPTEALPPFLVLVSDGHPTDEFSDGLNALLSQPWGREAVRVSIAIGKDADLDTLGRFMGHPELKPIQANNPEGLTRYIRWASVIVKVPPVQEIPNPETEGLNDSLPDDVW